MTALNSPLTVRADQGAFRRGVAAGVIASLVLALTLTVGALAAGLLPDVDAIVPADLVAPAAPAAPVAPVVPDVVPPQVVTGPVNPDLPIDYYNPWQKGPARLY